MTGSTCKEWVGTGILVPEAEVGQAGYRRPDFRNVPLTCVPLPAVGSEMVLFSEWKSFVLLKI